MAIYRWFTVLKHGWIFPWQTVSHNQMVITMVMGIKQQPYEYQKKGRWLGWIALWSHQTWLRLMTSEGIHPLIPLKWWLFHWCSPLIFHVIPSTCHSYIPFYQVHMPSTSPFLSALQRPVAQAEKPSLVFVGVSEGIPKDVQCGFVWKCWVNIPNEIAI